MIHGRFQPFHNGHLEYMRGAADRSDELWIGITNPDQARMWMRSFRRRGSARATSARNAR